MGMSEKRCFSFEATRSDNSDNETFIGFIAREFNCDA